MDQFQSIQAAYIIRDVLATEGMNVFTIISAYLVVAYFVGAKLSRFQLSAITALYTAFCLGPIAGFYMAVIDLKAINHGTGILYTVDHPWAVPFVMIAGWSLSILFMFNARRNVVAVKIEKARNENP
ncbi:MAG: hypothetical protein ACI915_000270 [Gammaproteobacteria bacterium]|jgi:hypothetical protein